MSAKGQGDPGEDHASRVGAESPCSDMKRAVAKKMIERYFYQLTDGCGNPYCDNQNCASSGKVTNLTPDQAAAQAIQLFSQEARLCDGTQPSKVARTTLEPGPASLAKSLPVKSVNPTCSDEGIASNTSPDPLITEPITQPVIVNMDISDSTNVPNEPTIHIIDTCTRPVISKESIISFSSSKMRVNSDSHLCELLKSRHDSVASISNKSISSDEETFLKVFDRYKIYIPNCNNIPIGKQNNIDRNRKKAPIKYREKKKLQRVRNICKTERKTSFKKRVGAKNCSRFFTKLLVLALYLRHIERKRYTKHPQKD